MYPEPDGVSYPAADLADEDTVVLIFDYCQIAEAAVFAKGWRFLFETYGLDGLLRIDERSGWFDEDDVVDAEESFVEHARDCGYDPVHDGASQSGRRRFTARRRRPSPPGEVRSTGRRAGDDWPEFSDSISRRRIGS